MKQTERDRLLKIAHTALDAAERILAPTQLQVTPPIPPIPPTLEAIDRGTELAERAAAIFSAVGDDDKARLLRRAAQRETTASPCRAGGIGCSWEPWQEAMGCRTPDEARARAEHAKLQLRVALETCTEYRQRDERATTERDEARNEIEQLRRQLDDLRAALAERERAS